MHNLATEPRKQSSNYEEPIRVGPESINDDPVPDVSVLMHTGQDGSSFLQFVLDDFQVELASRNFHPVLTQGGFQLTHRRSFSIVGRTLLIEFLKCCPALE